MPNPIEPPPFKTVRKVNPRFADVRGGQSGFRLDKAGVQPIGPTGFPAPEPESESYLRYDTGDGQGMREFHAGQEPTRGTFSMMTAPENVNAVTGPSQLQDLALEEELTARRYNTEMLQPYTGGPLPPPTKGEALERVRAAETAQETLERLDRLFGNIESQRSRFMEERLASGSDQATARQDADDYALRLERRAKAMAALASGRSLPSEAFKDY